MNFCLMFKALLIFEAYNKLLKFHIHTVQGVGESHMSQFPLHNVICLSSSLLHLHFVPKCRTPTFKITESSLNWVVILQQRWESDLNGLTFGDHSVENVFQFVGCDFHVLRRETGGESRRRGESRIKTLHTIRQEGYILFIRTLWKTQLVLTSPAISWKIVLNCWSSSLSSPAEAGAGWGVMEPQSRKR